MQSNISNTDKSSSTIQVIGNNISSEGVSPLDESMQFNMEPLETSTVQKIMNSSNLMTDAVDDTPKCKFLKQGIHKLSKQLVAKNKKLKELQQNLRRKEKKIASLKTIILQLKKQNLIAEDAGAILLDSFGPSNCHV